MLRDRRGKEEAWGNFVVPQSYCFCKVLSRTRGFGAGSAECCATQARLALGAAEELAGLTGSHRVRRVLGGREHHHWPVERDGAPLRPFGRIAYKGLGQSHARRRACRGF